MVYQEVMSLIQGSSPLITSADTVDLETLQHKQHGVTGTRYMVAILRGETAQLLFVDSFRGKRKNDQLKWKQNMNEADKV